jgi:uncharacterized protein (TIGR02996 family)
MFTAREALEAALVRTPGDLTLHMAYADCLIESGDSRGEYIRLCLAAEQPGASKKERRVRNEAAERYLQQHQSEWLGDLAEYLLSPDEPRRRIGSRPRVLLEWKRGWIVGITCYGIRRDFGEALRNLRYIPFLDSLSIDANPYRNRESTLRDPEDEDFDEMEGRSPYRLLQDWPGPSLRKLLIRDHYFGDTGLGYLFRSPYFLQLKSLSLTQCNLTDEGAALLAANPHTPMLESLRLEQNLISPLGIELLSEAGIRASDWQHFGRLEDV